MTRACTSCGAAHSRYAALCASCDPTYVAPVLRCVAPLRCYCARHRGRNTRELPAPSHQYGYDLARLLDGVA